MIDALLSNLMKGCVLLIGIADLLEVPQFFVFISIALVLGT